MKKIFKCAFVVAFAIATACAGFESVSASNDGIEPRGPVQGEIDTKDMVCPNCGMQGKMKVGRMVDADGSIRTVLMCFNCMSICEVLP
ncbi:MAG: hypothetical protein IJA57_02180 [Alistipes sp.]|nr:hypothetical protein [Alistipes sp.]MBR3702882.1 hypothetical protein [Alistipes sp.]